VLTGERVTLRPIRPDDLEQLHAWRLELATWGDTTEAAPFPMTFETFRQWSEDVAKNDGVMFAVEAAGRLVGRAAMFAFDPLARHAEVGLALGPEHRGLGYGREVLGMLLDFGFTHRNLHRIWLECSATNDRAVRAYRAAGFVEEGRLREHAWIDGAYVDVLRMAVLRRDWAARR